MSSANPEKVLRDQIAGLEAELSVDPRFMTLQILRKALTDIEALKSSTATPVVPGEPAAPRTTLLTGKWASSIPQAAQFALEDAGHPLPVRRLLAELPKYGKTVGGNDPAIGLSNTLSSHGAFESVTWRGQKAWWIKGKPLPSDNPLAGAISAEG